MRNCLILLLSLGYQCAIAQDYSAISGKVINSETKESLPFATVGLKNHPIGTVTNADGDFIFYMPDELPVDSLFISHIGYATFTIATSDAIASTPLTIDLAEKTVLLKEIEVNAEQLTATEIMQRALERLETNFYVQPFLMKGFFRDIREQNGTTVYLTEASIDIQDPGYSSVKNLRKKFFLKGVRASDSRIHKMLSGSLLNAGNALVVNLESNFWLNTLKNDIRKLDYKIDDVIMKDDKLFYVISTQKTASKSDLAEQFSDMRYTLTHKYHVETESYAINRVEHLESPIEGQYVGIERPYEGDTLFYSKKGWNQVIEFEEYEGKMYLKYQDVSYAFDIVNHRQKSVYLDMAYQFTFVATDIKTDQPIKPEGKRMRTNKSLVLQSGVYEPAFWEDFTNTKLSPLTAKQHTDLSKERSLEAQFRASKKKTH